MRPNFGQNKLKYLRRYCIHSVFGVIVCCDLELWPLIQNLIRTSMNPNTSVVKIGWNFLHWFVRYGVQCVHKVFGTHIQTHSLCHSLTDGQTRLQNAFWNPFSTVDSRGSFRILCDGGSGEELWGPSTLLHPLPLPSLPQTQLGGLGAL